MVPIQVSSCINPDGYLESQDNSIQIVVENIQIKKGQIIQQKGDQNDKVYFVKSGLLRSYSIDEKGKEHIFMFAPEGWTMGDAGPVGQPAQLFFDALEDTEALVFTKGEDDDPDMDKILRRLYTLQMRIIMLMSATVAERYEHFITTYPDIVQRVPQKMIASYLGITPERLSTVKGQRNRSSE